MSDESASNPNGFWRTYALHDDNFVKGFFGEFRYLSNFEPCHIDYEGLFYPSTEHAFQAAKIQPQFRHNMVHITAAESKKEWRKHPLVDNAASEWDARKYDVMCEVVFQKFLKHKELRAKLISTGHRHLEELNHWGDKIWGVDVTTGVGTNWLGLILMVTREYWI